ncbi:aminopeptidase P family protein [Candidatus Gottesmanbacteria bacterium]|nr:aminopeptidase P family protein [Candidatus Gottesmanbacteria bacterium]
MNPSLSQLQEKLHHLNLDALFISDQYNVSYLSLFTGLSPNEKEGFLFITKNKIFLLTFSTYYGLFRQRDDLHCLCITPQTRLSHHLDKICRQEEIKRIGFEKTNLTVSELESLEKKVKANWIPTLGIVEKLRQIKSSKELQKIKKAATITDEAFKFVKSKIKKGISEKELALEIELFLKRRAGDVAFPPIVAFNDHSSIPHYIPSTNYKLQTNSLILLDFGAKVDGYCADMTRVIFYGKPKNEYLNIYNVVKDTQQKALNSLKPGIKAEMPDKIAKKNIRKHGYPEYLHGLGHGVGLAIHEDPRLKIGNNDLLKSGMVVTVEPGIYIDNLCGVRIEDLVVLNKTGIEILSKSTKEIIII